MELYLHIKGVGLTRNEVRMALVKRENLLPLGSFRKEMDLLFDEFMGEKGELGRGAHRTGSYDKR
jgi:hypothetical protein